MTVQMRIGDVKRDAEIKFSRDIQQICCHVFDKSTDIISFAQMCLIVRVVSTGVEGFEEFAVLHSMQGQTKEIGFLANVTA
jgi:hypothetical protein